MKKLLVIIILFCGCTSREDYTLSQMKSPVILIGKRNGPNYISTITLRDGKGKIMSCYSTPLAISLAFRNIGDTIK